MKITNNNKEIRQGWIKLYRRILNDLSGLTDPEYRYYQSSLLLAVWDERSKFFGTFDARTKVIKREALPSWSVGKINMTKNSLIEKCAYRVMPEHRLEIVNAKFLFRKTKDVEKIIQTTEQNFHLSENNFQSDEDKIRGIRNEINDIAINKRVSWRLDSIG